MKKLLLLVILFSLVLMPLVSATKNVTYISQEDCWNAPNTCDCFVGEDKYYCARLESLGYSVLIETEGNVLSGSPEWTRDAQKSQIIFIGNITDGAIAGPPYGAGFCRMVNGWQQQGKKYFHAFRSTQKGYMSELDGCVFQWGWVDFSGTDNYCTKKYFPILKKGYITEKFDVGQTILMYSQDRKVKLHDYSSGDDWLAVNCNPGPGERNYPIMSTHLYGAFWGLDHPSDFTSDAWYIFDRTIYKLMGDDTLTVDAFTIPERVTLNKDFWIVANVTQMNKPVESGDVNFSYLSVKGDMYYENSFWFNKTSKITEPGLVPITVNAYKDSLYGSDNVDVNTGELTVFITSSHYNVGGDYVVGATFWYGEGPVVPDNANYKIRFSDNLSIAYSGSLECGENICETTINTIKDLGEQFVLEVSAYATDIGHGGSFKIISKTSSLQPVISTDKDSYQPGDIIYITLTTSVIGEEANFSFYDPDDEALAEDIPLDQNASNPFLWHGDYSLGTSALDGIYKIESDSIIEGNEFTTSKNVDVVAWNAYLDLNKHSFEREEYVEISVGAIDVFDDNLDFEVYIYLIDPDDDEELLDDGSWEGEESYNTSYRIPSDAEKGLYKLEVNVTDEDDRSVLLTDDFTVETTTVTSDLFVNPTSMSITTVPGKYMVRTFTVENRGDEFADNIGIFIDSEIDFVEVLSMPNSISSDSDDELKLEIDTGGLTEETYSGKVNVTSSIGDDSIAVSIEIIGDLSAEADYLLADLQSLESNITELDGMGKDVSDLRDLYDDTEDLLGDVKTEYDNENYASARSKLNDANDNIYSLRSQIESMYYENGEVEGDLSWIIWAVAGIVVIVVVGFVVIRYRDRIMRYINKLLGKEEDEEYEEEYYYPEGGEYRTEYY